MSSIILFTVTVAAGAGCGRGKTSAPGAGASGSEAAARPVPVTVVAVAKRDVPIYLDGLGTVTAYKTVTVRPQVDGRLLTVNFREGQAVKRGDLLAQIDPRPFQAQLHQAEGALARDTALLNNARLNQQRYTSLRGQNLIAQQQLDDQMASVGQYEGALRVDQAQIENARLQLEYARIVAPIDGVTGVRLIDEGNLVRVSDANGLLVITQIDPIAVLFTLPEDELQRVAPRLAQGGLPVEAYSRDGESKLATGELLLIDNQINQATASLRLKAVFRNEKRQLWPNQFVKTRLLLTVRKDALVVPAAAVQRGPKGTFAYVVGADQTASPRPLQVAEVTSEMALISGGLNAGEQVVIEGQSQLRPGSRVSVSAPQPKARAGAGAEKGGGPGGPGGGPGGGSGGGGGGKP